MKKVLAALAMATCLAVGTASAGTYTVACQSFSWAAQGNGYLANNFTQGPTALLCPGFSGMGTLSSLSANVIIGTDFTGPNSGLTDTVVTTYTSSLAGFVTDTLTASTTGNPTVTAYTQSGSLALGTNPDFFVDPSSSLLGGYDPVTGFAAFNVSYTTGASGGNGSVGQVQGDSGQVYVQYTYATPVSSPEPVSMLLLGTGLLGVSLLGRKFVRK